MERSTCQATWFCGTPALALVRSVPSTAAGERRYLVAASSSVPQVTSHVSASSWTGLSEGQLYLLNAAIAS